MADPFGVESVDCTIYLQDKPGEGFANDCGLNSKTSLYRALHRKENSSPGDHIRLQTELVEIGETVDQVPFLLLRMGRVACMPGSFRKINIYSCSRVT